MTFRCTRFRDNDQKNSQLEKVIWDVYASVQALRNVLVKTGRCRPLWLLKWSDSVSGEKLISVVRLEPSWGVVAASLLLNIQKWRSGSICHDPKKKKTEIKCRQVPTTQEQLFDVILAV
ncbi:hypothetical protein PS15m_001942 [Mucor circinelloides]